MFNFFKKKKKRTKPENLKVTQQTPTTAPGTQIRYAENLIDELIADHKDLLSLFGQVNTAFNSGNYTLVIIKLKAFKVALVDHLLTENVRLYIYLNHSLSYDEFNSDLIKGFRSEMNQIAKTVMTFIKKYETLGVDKELAISFGRDLEAIGGVLVERIQREESTLYPLYMPSY